MGNGHNEESLQMQTEGGSGLDNIQDEDERMYKVLLDTQS